jgi:hypothetical protein
MTTRWITWGLIIVLLAGCVSLTADAERVRLTRNPDEVRACTSLGILHAVSLWGGQSGVYIGWHNNEHELLNATARRRGDTLLLLKEMPGFTTHSVGEAYHCGGAWAADP